MLLVLEAQSPCSIAEVAKALGCKPASLYRHMRMLLQAGLAAEAGRRTAGRRWTTHSREGPLLRATHFDAPTGRGLAEHGRLVACLARPAARQFQRAATALRGQSQASAQRQLSAMFERTWMDDRQLDAFKRLVLRMFRLVQRGRRTRRGMRYQVSLMASPVI
jgi:transposase-like protein